MKGSLKLLRTITITIFFAMVVFGCVKKPEAVNQAVNQNANVRTEKINSSSGEKIYQDTQYGFEFEFPAEWNLEITTFNRPSSPIFYLYNNEPIVYLEENDLRISFYATTTELSISKWFEKNNEFKESDVQEIISFMNSELGPGALKSSDIEQRLSIGTLNGRDTITQYVKFKKPEGLEGGPITRKNLFILNEGTVLVFTAISPTGIKAEKLLNEFDLVMKTLKFN